MPCCAGGRARPKKSDGFVLDFQNDTGTIEKSFADDDRTTILSSETDAKKRALNGLEAEGKSSSV